MKYKLKQLITLIGTALLGNQPTMANSPLESPSPESFRQGGNDSFLSKLDTIIKTNTDQTRATKRNNNTSDSTDEVEPTQNDAVLPIIENESNVIGFSQENYFVNENDGTATFTVERNCTNDFSSPVSVSYRVKGDQLTTAYGSSGDWGDYITYDYNGDCESYSCGTLTWGEDDCASKTFDISINNDSEVESDETIVLELYNPSKTTLNRNYTILTIIDDDKNDDGSSVIKFFPRNYTVNENASQAVIWVDRVGCIPESPSVSVSYSSHDKSAISGEDYQAVTGTLTWEEGDCTAKWFNVPIIDNFLLEKNGNDIYYPEREILYLGLDTPTGDAKLGSINTAKLTIVDDDDVSIIGFSKENYYVNEGDKSVNITIERTNCLHDLTGKIGIFITTDNEGTAKKYDDFRIDSYYSYPRFSWAAGHCESKSFPVDIKEDSLFEGNETVILEIQLSSSYNVTFGQSRAVLTIQDNDPAPVKMKLNQTRYTAGEILQLDMTIQKIEEANFYVAMVFPDGNFVTLGYPDKWSVLNTPQPYLSHIADNPVYSLLNLPVPVGLAFGNYSACGILVSPDVNVLNQSHWIHSDCAKFEIYDNSTVDLSTFRNTLQDGSLGPEMVWIPAGTFRMGDIQGEEEEDEQPVHDVSVSRFAMGRYEVTFAEYDKFAEATGREKPYDYGWGRGNHPVIHISWYDAMAYAEWLSEQTGYQYRLPTEAEWEYAARAGTNTNYWWGNEIGYNRANCNDDCSDNFEGTAPIGWYTPNLFGLYDTVGNVWEWTCTLYKEQYQRIEKPCFIKNDATPDKRVVIRGGSFYNRAKNARSASRDWYWSGKRYINIGMRLVKNP
ncbi:SUMF1/EgtB/PvdO family nonheme iron enzyme [Candidatus Parabeggiatoa sp. HSG14]|uniref:SUMF1/EgtB/PvdO family nonheme iron enzyme n=1 Tax=Candidatus Parabeggiatoa sp. HSG14 TaxID=3055593 RepID=UPI0025A8C5E8|nr:SUMF1/EgtB/PvdO family nonheme iron enzyme [Thiotrichales bacterium HSG14]